MLSQAQLFVSVIGDALIEPFWPEGLGINRGLLSALDTVFVVQKYFHTGHVADATANHMLAARSELFDMQKKLHGKSKVRVWKTWLVTWTWA